MAVGRTQLRCPLRVRSSPGSPVATMRHMMTGSLAAMLAAVTLAFALAGCSNSTGPVEPTTLPTEFSGTGSFVAGEDIAPGRYLQVEPEPACRYTLLSTDGVEITFGKGDALLIVEDGQTVRIEDCGTYEWRRGS